MNLIEKWKIARQRIIDKEVWLKKPRTLSAEQIYLFCLYVMLNVFDFFMTSISVRLHFDGEPIMAESNNLVAGLFSSGEYLSIMSLKFGMTAIIAIMFYFLMRRANKSYEFVRASWFALVTFYILVIFHNILQLNIVVNFYS